MIGRQSVDRQGTEGAARAFGEQARGGEVGAGQQDSELLAADSSGDGIIARCLTKQGRESFDHTIAAGVAETVVDRLEMIEVRDRQGDRQVPARGVPQRQLRVMLEAAAIEQAGQGVGFRARSRLRQRVAHQHDQHQQCQRQRQHGADGLRDHGVGRLVVRRRVDTPASQEMSKKRLRQEMQPVDGKHRHQESVEPGPSRPAAPDDGDADELHDGIGKLIGHHACQRLPLHALRQPDHESGNDQENDHRPCRERSGVLAGQRHVEDDRRQQEDGEGGRHRQVGLAQCRYGEFHAEIGHADAIGGGETERRPPRALIGGDSQEGRREQPRDEQIDPEDEVRAVHTASIHHKRAKIGLTRGEGLLRLRDCQPARARSGGDAGGRS